MSDRIDLPSGEQIREWAKRNGFDVVNVESDAPRFFQPRFASPAGPQFLFSVEHTYLAGDGRPVVSVKRVIRSASAEDALYQYFREPRERSAGTQEYLVGFATHMKPGSNDGEVITVAKLVE